MTELHKEDAITRMMRELKLDDREAALEIKRRIKRIKSILALAKYVEWGRDNSRLIGGEPVSTVNYRRIDSILRTKPYTANDVLTITVWDLVDLMNIKNFNDFRKESDVLLLLDEILMLTRQEYAVIKTNRVQLLKRRKIS